MNTLSGHQPTTNKLSTHKRLAHKEIEPAILYFGTPVVLVTTLNEDGTANIAPISSIWWLGWSCMIGLDASSQTAENLMRTKECVLNLPSDNQVEAVDRLAKTTGRTKLPLHKKSLGYRYEADKFKAAGLTQQSAVGVSAPRVEECPVQLEATLAKTVPFGEKNSKMAVPSVAFELNIEHVHVVQTLLSDPNKSYVDPDKWHPLIMSFRKYYSTRDYIHESKLAVGAEGQYAPWKQKGLKRKITQWLLKRNTKQYAQKVKRNQHA